METETIASRNVVSLLLDEVFNASICKVDPETVTDEDYVYGWDC